MCPRYNGMDQSRYVCHFPSTRFNENEILQVNKSDNVNDIYKFSKTNPLTFSPYLTLTLISSPLPSPLHMLSLCSLVPQHHHTSPLHPRSPYASLGHSLFSLLSNMVPSQLSPSFPLLHSLHYIIPSSCLPPPLQHLLSPYSFNGTCPLDSPPHLPSSPISLPSSPSLTPSPS